VRLSLRQRQWLPDERGLVPAKVDGCKGTFEIETAREEVPVSACSGALSAHTCQQYGSRRSGICAPFVLPDTSIFVPAGETIESLEGDIEALLFEADINSSGLRAVVLVSVSEHKKD
jgi:hypothetical protein